MSIKLKLDGFEELIKEIQKAEGNVEKATEKCMRKSADIMQETLISEMAKADTSYSVYFDHLIARMPPPEIENDYGLITARVGYKKGAYNPDNLSDGYKVVFINYGTPRRSKHGKIEGKSIKLGFIQRAKRKAKKPIQQQQEATLKEILKGLER